MDCFSRKDNKAIIENIDVQRTDTILAIGFGYGSRSLTRKLLDKNPLKIYGTTDCTTQLNEMTEVYQQYIKQGIMQLFFDDRQHLPLKNSSIDKAYNIGYIHIWEDLHQKLSEIHRVLKSDGIFISVFKPKEWEVRPEIRESDLFYRYTLEEIEKAMIENGLKPERTIEVRSKELICIVSRKGI